MEIMYHVLRIWLLLVDVKLHQRITPVVIVIISAIRSNAVNLMLVSIQKSVAGFMLSMVSRSEHKRVHHYFIDFMNRCDCVVYIN